MALSAPMDRRWKRRTTLSSRWGLVLGVALLASAGCANFRRLNRDIKAYEDTPHIQGEVAPEGWKAGPIRVFLFRETADGRPPTLEHAVVLERPGKFNFAVRDEGRYLLAAYEDIDGSTKHEPTEPVAAYDGFRSFAVDPEDPPADLQLKLEPRAPERLLELKEKLTFNETRLAAGDELPLSAERFGPESGPFGVWQPLTAYQEQGAGIYRLGPHDPSKQPVLFIHGMSGYPQEFTHLIGQLKGTAYQPWVAQYPSGFRLGVVARGLLRAMELTQAKLDVPRVCVVAHSMGGLVAHKLVRDHYRQDKTPDIPFLMTWVSPLGGIPSADAGVKHAPAVVPSWRDIGPKSDYVTHLFDRELPSSLYYALYFGYGEKDGDGTVKLWSQLRKEAQDMSDRVRGFDADHVGVLEDEGALSHFLADLSAGCPVVESEPVPVDTAPDAHESAPNADESAPNADASASESTD